MKWTLPCCGCSLCSLMHLIWLFSGTSVSGRMLNVKISVLYCTAILRWSGESLGLWTYLPKSRIPVATLLIHFAQVDVCFWTNTVLPIRFSSDTVRAWRTNSSSVVCTPFRFLQLIATWTKSFVRILLPSKILEITPAWRYDFWRKWEVCHALM